MNFFNHGSGKLGFPLPSFSMAYSHQWVAHPCATHRLSKNGVFQQPVNSRGFQNAEKNIASVDISSRYIQ
ncbi:hypothetical protein [Thiolapillus sp.]|uniref:hypothetical protein n=1 Tax=Thiolapillus sp. TaxID=2017437 RepID=UPI003AF80214